MTENAQIRWVQRKLTRNIKTELWLLDDEKTLAAPLKISKQHMRQVPWATWNSDISDYTNLEKQAKSKTQHKRIAWYDPKRFWFWPPKDWWKRSFIHLIDALVVFKEKFICSEQQEKAMATRDTLRERKV